MAAPKVEAATYTHGHHESVLRSHSWRTAENSAAYLLPHLQPDSTILDVGCGPGTITVDLARRVPAGRVVGLDPVAAVLERARAAAAAAQGPGLANVEFVVGDANALAYPDNAFDVVHCHQVLQHVQDPVAILREMRRVAKAGGGVVAARESDYAAFTWYPAMPDLTEWLDVYRRVGRANGGDLDAGRSIHVWAKRAGFARADVQCSASTWTFYTPDDVRWWGEMWADRTVSSAFAQSAVQTGLATQADLERYAAAWRRWSQDEDGWFMATSAEILCFKR